MNKQKQLKNWGVYVYEGVDKNTMKLWKKSCDENREYKIAYLNYRSIDMGDNVR